MSNKRTAAATEIAAEVGNVETVLTAMEAKQSTDDLSSMLADTAAKRDEAIMCLRLIAGLNPMLRDKAEQTIEALSKIPFPEGEQH
ncbi:MAG: hypothetical protein AAFQ42_07505 [Pseudomonadota bacterium]